MEERQISDLPVQYSAEAARLAEQLRARLGAPAGNRIRTGQQKKFIQPDGEEGAPGAPMDLIIVDFTSRNEFYPGVYNPNDRSPPACFAIGNDPTNMVPSSNSPEKQAESCGVCPNNQWGSGPRGNGKACKNQRFLAVLPADGTTAEHAIWTLAVSPTAVKRFEEYVRGLVSKKISPFMLVTEVGFDPGSDYPTFTFKAVRPLGSDEVTTVMGRIPEAADILATEPDVSGYGKQAQSSPMSRARAGKK